MILRLFNFREHLKTFPHSKDGSYLSVPGAHTAAHICRASRALSQLLAPVPHWAKPIISYKSVKNRLPKSTGRAEVTVLPVDFLCTPACRSNCFSMHALLTDFRFFCVSCERIRAKKSTLRRLMTDAPIETSPETSI